MITTFRSGRALAAAIMLMAVVASFAGPSVISTIGLLDGDAGSAAAGGMHLPLDMAAAPDQFTEAAGPTFGFEGPVRIVPVSSGRTPVRDTGGCTPPVRESANGRTPSKTSLLCVYRL